MRTVQLPPICPFGDQSDAAIFRLPSSRHHVFALTENGDQFLRISVYDDGELAYTIGNLADTKQDLYDLTHENESLVTFDDGAAEQLAAWGFTEFVKTRGNVS